MTKKEKEPKAVDPVFNVAPDLEDLLMDITLIDEDPGNENTHEHEQVKMLAEAYQNVRMQKPINVYKKEDGRYETKAGHAQLRAALLLGWTHIPAVRFDGNEQEAAVFRISDNTISRMSTMNEVKLAASAAKLSQSMEGFKPSHLGLAESEFDRITADLLKGSDVPPMEPPEPPPETPPGDEGDGNRGGGLGKPVIQYNLVFDNEDQQKAWYAFVRSLKAAYPQEETNAARIDKFITAWNAAAAGEMPAAQPAEVAEGPVGRDFYVLGFKSPSEYRLWLEMTHFLQEEYGSHTRPTQAILQLFSAATRK